jgi:hypothetical protein
LEIALAETAKCAVSASKSKVAFPKLKFWESPNSIASQGKTIDEAIANLKEAISLYYEDEMCG